MPENDRPSDSPKGELKPDRPGHWLLFIAELQRIQMQLQERRDRTEPEDDAQPST